MTFTIATGDDIANKRWSEALYNDMIMGEPLIASMINDGVVRIESDLSKNAGDRVRVNYSKRLNAEGILGDAPKRSAAVTVSYVNDDVTIDQLSLTTKAKTKGSITQQRIAFDLSDATYEEASNWGKQRAIVSTFNQLGGNTATSITFDGVTVTGTDRVKYTGLQLPTAPSTYRKKFATGSADETVAAATSATLTLQSIDTLVTEALTQRSGVNNFKKLTGKNWNGMPYDFVFYVPVSGITQLLQQAASGGNLTLATEINNMLNGGSKDTYAGAGRTFVYRRTKVVEVPDHYIPFGVNSGTSAAEANSKRSLFCGKDAISLAFGKGYQPANGDPVVGFSLVNDKDDIEQEVITLVTVIMGTKKAVVKDTPSGTGYDQSVITYTHYVS